MAGGGEETVAGLVADHVLAAARAAGRPLVAGLCGAQGSGKSTAALRIAGMLGEAGLKTAILSIDDLYLTRPEREALARDVHPLLLTRGVPGTHDVALGCGVLDALAAGETVALPRFDKAADTRAPQGDWARADGPVDVVLFEGWCLGARPQPEEALADPVNALERDEDADGRWRAYVNRRLGGDYRDLFARVDTLALMAAPGWEVVGRWRAQQEDELRARAGAGALHVMDAARLSRFMQHYERLTRHILRDMPRHADLVLELAPDRRVTHWYAGNRAGPSR